MKHYKKESHSESFLFRPVNTRAWPSSSHGMTWVGWEIMSFHFVISFFCCCFCHFTRWLYSTVAVGALHLRFSWKCAGHFIRSFHVVRFYPFFMIPCSKWSSSENFVSFLCFFCSRCARFNLSNYSSSLWFDFQEVLGGDGLTCIACDGIERLKDVIFMRQYELRWFRLQNAFQYSRVDLTAMRRIEKEEMLNFFSAGIFLYLYQYNLWISYGCPMTRSARGKT